MFFKEVDFRLAYKYRVVNTEQFEDALLRLTTLSLEDDQVIYPKIDQGNMFYLFGGNTYDLYLLNRKKLPPSGSFEIAIEDNYSEIVGFIRAIKYNKIISINLIHIQEESRGSGIGTSIYIKLLDSNYIIKSDSEITDSTYNLYLKLFSKGYTPLIFNDGSVGFKK